MLTWRWPVTIFDFMSKIITIYVDWSRYNVHYSNYISYNTKLHLRSRWPTEYGFIEENCEEWSFGEWRCNFVICLTIVRAFAVWVVYGLGWWTLFVLGDIYVGNGCNNVIMNSTDRLSVCGISWMTWSYNLEGIVEKYVGPFSLLQWYSNSACSVIFVIIYKQMFWQV